MATLTLLSLTQAPVTPVPTPTLRLLRTPSLAATGLIVRTLAPTPLPLPITPPDCYETPVGGLWCLGWLHNRLLIPIEQVVVQVYLVTTDGTALTTQETPIARNILWPGERSPYGVRFEHIPEGTAGPVAVITSATRAPVPTAPPVEVRDVRTEQRDSVLHVAGSMGNAGPTPVDQLSVVVTLLDERERVTGFRMVRWPPEQALDPGDSLPFAVDVIPQGMSATRVEVSAEGRVY
jgi:hypothetical protein